MKLSTLSKHYACHEPLHHTFRATPTTTLQDLFETALWTRSGKSSNECSVPRYPTKRCCQPIPICSPICLLAMAILSFTTRTRRRPDPYDTSASYTTAAKRRRASVSPIRGIRYAYLLRHTSTCGFAQTQQAIYSITCPITRATSRYISANGHELEPQFKCQF